MSRRTKGVIFGFIWVAAVIASIVLHSIVAFAIVLFAGLTAAYVVGIAWMRTTPDRVKRRKAQ